MSNFCDKKEANFSTLNLFNTGSSSAFFIVHL